METKMIVTPKDPFSAERTYTVLEIAAILKMKPRTAYALCSENPPFKVLHIGRSVRVSLTPLDFEQLFSTLSVTEKGAFKKGIRVKPPKPADFDLNKEKPKKICIFFGFSFWCARRDSNPRPTGS